MQTTSYTAFVKFASQGCVEEIDVQALSKDDAYNRTQEVLASDYEPGGQIVKIVRSDRLPGWVSVSGW